MVKIVDEMLDYTARKPGRAVAWILVTATGILVAYWTSAGHFGESARALLGLALIVGAIAFVSRHMSRRAKTEEYATIKSRVEVATTDALNKYHAGEPLTLTDVAALRARREGEIS